MLIFKRILRRYCIKIFDRLYKRTTSFEKILMIPFDVVLISHFINIFHTHATIDFAKFATLAKSCSKHWTKNSKTKRHGLLKNIVNRLKIIKREYTMMLQRYAFCYLLVLCIIFLIIKRTNMKQKFSSLFTDFQIVYKWRAKKVY